MNEYVRSYFDQIEPQVSNAVEKEGTYNLIAANAAMNQNDKQTTGGIARRIMSEKTDLLGMTSDEIEDKPYEATAKFLKQSIVDVGVRVFKNTQQQLESQGMDAYKAATVAERIASNTVNNLIKPLYSDTFDEQKRGVDNLIAIMTKPNVNNGKVEIDLSRITMDDNGQKPINSIVEFNDGQNNYKIQPIDQESYTPYISKGIDMGGEWFEGTVKGLGSLGSSTLAGQAVVGGMEMFDIDAAEWIGARREFERQVMGGNNGALWATVYTGRDMVGTIGETIAITGATGGWAGPLVQTPIRSALNEWIEESGQLSMQYVTGDDRLKANTNALLSNILFDTATMATSIGIGKVAESAYQAIGVTKAMPEFLRATANGTIMRNALRTTADLTLDAGIDLSFYKAMGANMEDESMLTQNTRNMYNEIAKLPDFTDPKYNEALLNFAGRKLAGRFIGGLANLKPKEGDDLYDTPGWNETHREMNKLQSYINRIVAPPSSWRSVDELIRSKAITGGSESLPVNLESYIKDGAGFKDLFKLYLDQEFQQSRLFVATKAHKSLFGSGKFFDTESALGKVHQVVSVIDDIHKATQTFTPDEANAYNTAKGYSSNIVKEFVELKSKFGKLTDIDIANTVNKNEAIADEIIKPLGEKAVNKYKNAKQTYIERDLKKKGFAKDTIAKIISGIQNHKPNQKGYIKFGMPFKLNPAGETVPDDVNTKLIEEVIEVTDNDKQNMVNTFYDESTITPMRQVQIATTGDAEYKWMNVDSDEYKNWMNDKLKLIKTKDFTTGLGIRTEAERKTLQEAFKDVQDLAAELLKTQSYSTGQEVIENIRPTLSKAASILLNRYSENIKTAYNTVGSDIVPENKAIIYASNISKIASIVGSVGDMVRDQVTDIKNDLYKVKGLPQAVGLELSKMEQFDDAYAMAKEIYGDTDTAKYATVNEVFKQIENKAMFLSIKKNNMSKLYLGNHTDDAKAMDVIHLIEFDAGISNEDTMRARLKVLARSVAIATDNNILVEDENNKVVYNEAKSLYANKYMKQYIISGSIDREKLSGDAIEDIIIGTTLKFKEVETDLSKGMMIDLITTLGEAGIKLDPSKLQIESNGSIKMLNGFLTTETQIAETNNRTALITKLQDGKNASRILDSLTKMYWQSDYNDKSDDTYIDVKPGGYLYKVGGSRYTFDEVFEMYSEAAGKEYNYNLYNVASTVVKLANTAQDAKAYMRKALHNINPELYGKMNTNDKSAVQFNRFISKIVNDEYVNRQQIANIDLNTREMIFKAQETNSGSVSLYEGKYIFSIDEEKDESYAHKKANKAYTAETGLQKPKSYVENFLTSSASDLVRLGWVPLQPKGATGERLFVKLPYKKGEHGNNDYAYRMMIEKFQTQFAEIFDDTTDDVAGRSILEVLNKDIKSIADINRNLIAAKDVMLKALKAKQEAYLKAQSNKYELPKDQLDEATRKNTIIEYDSNKFIQRVQGSSVFADLLSTIDKQIKTLEAFTTSNDPGDVLSRLYTYAHYGIGAMVADSFAKRGGGLSCFGDPKARVAAYMKVLDMLERNNKLVVDIIPGQTVDGKQINDGADNLSPYLMKSLDKIFGDGSKASINYNGMLIKMQANTIRDNVLFNNIYGDTSYLNKDNIMYAPNIKIITPNMLTLFEQNKITTANGVEIIRLTGSDARKMLEARFLHAIRNPEVKDIKDSDQLGTADVTYQRYANINEISHANKIYDSMLKTIGTEGVAWDKATKAILQDITRTREQVGASLVVENWTSNGYGNINSYKLAESWDNYSSVGALSDKFIAGLLNKTVKRMNKSDDIPEYIGDNFKQFKRFADDYIEIVNKDSYSDNHIVDLEYKYKDYGFTLKTILNAISDDPNPVLHREADRYYFLGMRQPLTQEGGKVAMLLTHIVPNSNRVYLSGTSIVVGDLDFDGDTGNVPGNKYLSKLYKDYYNNIIEDMYEAKSFEEIGLRGAIEVVNNYHSLMARMSSDVKLADIPLGTKVSNEIEVETRSLMGKLVGYVKHYTGFARTRISDADNIGNIIPELNKDVALSNNQKAIYEKMLPYRIKKVNENVYSIMYINHVRVDGLGALPGMRFSDTLKTPYGNIKVGVSDVGYDNTKKNITLVHVDQNGFGYKVLRHGKINVVGDNQNISKELSVKLDNYATIEEIDNKLKSLYIDDKKFTNGWDASIEYFKDGNHRLLTKNNINVQIYKAGTDQPKTRELSRFAMDYPEEVRETFIGNLIQTAYANSLLDFDGIEGQKVKYNQFSINSKTQSDIKSKYELNPEGYAKLLKELDAINVAMSKDNLPGEIRSKLFDTPKDSKDISYSDYRTIAKLFTRNGKLEQEEIEDNEKLLSKYLPAYIEKLGISVEDNSYNADTINMYPTPLIRAAVVYNMLKQAPNLIVFEDEVRSKFYTDDISKLSKDNLPVKIKSTGQTAKATLDKLNDSLMELSSGIFDNLKDVTNNYQNELGMPLDISSQKVRSKQELLNRIAIIHNANKYEQLHTIDGTDVADFFIRNKITVEDKGPNVSPLLKADDNILTTEKLYEVFNNRAKEIHDIKFTDNMNKDTELVRQGITDRVIFKSVIAMLNMNQRRSLYFRSLGLSDTLMKDIKRKSNKATGKPQIDFDTLKLFAQENIGSRYKMTTEDIVMPDYKFMETC